VTGLVAYLLLFLVVGIGFIFVHLVAGKLVRPAKMDAEKATIYECGEPTIGSAWIQFDLRFYVIALLFVVFDVEVAFFFPWAVVFGKASALANPDLPAEQRQVLTYELSPTVLAERDRLIQGGEDWPFVAGGLGVAGRVSDLDARVAAEAADNAARAHQLAWLAFLDILFFFGVLLVGFAYLWKRGDLVWVRSTAAEKMAVAPDPSGAPAGPRELVGAAR
jgi:NADH-quinone oxidoreductase subunit A